MKGILFSAVIPSHARVAGLLGEEWLPKRLEKVTQAFRKKVDLSPSGQGQTYGRLRHELVAELYDSNNHALREGRPGSTPLLDLLERDLAALGSVLPDDARRRGRHEEDASKLMYELHIAAGFARLGNSVLWLPDEGKKRAEMIVGSDTAAATLVECKKRDRQDGYEATASQVWSHLQHKLLRAMEREQLNYWVAVFSPDFRLADVDQVVVGAITAMKERPDGAVISSDDRYRIEWVRLCGPGGSVSSNLLRRFPRSTYGISVSAIAPEQIRPTWRPGDPGTVGMVANPKLIRMDLVDDPQHRLNGVLRNVKNAAEQVKRDLPSIVYIDVNLLSIEREYAEFDEMVARVRRQLRGAHHSVSAVVLTNICPVRTLDGDLGLRLRTELVLQEDPKHPLPERLRFVGDGTHWLSGTYVQDPPLGDFLALENRVVAPGDAADLPADVPV